MAKSISGGIFTAQPMDLTSYYRRVPTGERECEGVMYLSDAQACLFL